MLTNKEDSIDQSDENFVSTLNDDENYVPTNDYDNEEFKNIERDTNFSTSLYSTTKLISSQPSNPKMSIPFNLHSAPSQTIMVPIRMMPSHEMVPTAVKILLWRVERKILVIV